MPSPKIIRDIKSLKDDIINLRNNQLTGRYYIPTVSRISGAPVNVEANPLPTTWTGSDKSYSNGGYTISTNTSVSAANPLSNAFNNDEYNAMRAMVIAGGSIDVILKLPDAIKISSFKTYIPAQVGTDYLTISGSNNGSTWSIIYGPNYSFDGALTTRNIDQSKIGNYQYYKFTIFVESTGDVEIREIQLGTYSVDTYINNFTISNIPDTLAIYQRIMMKTPDFSNTGVTSNNLNSINIDTLLLPNRYYELVYDGSMYLAREVI